MNSFIKNIKTKFIAGFVALIPIVLTFYVFRFVYTLMNQMSNPIVKKYLNIEIPFFGIIVIIISIYLLGLIVTNLICKKKVEDLLVEYEAPEESPPPSAEREDPRWYSDSDLKKYFDMDILTDVITFNLSDNQKDLDAEIYISWERVCDNANIYNDRVNNEFKSRMILPLSLSYDHRIIDGAEAARFCYEIKENLGKNFAYKLAI